MNNKDMLADRGERKMGDCKLVPLEPTPAMVEAAEEAHMPFGDMDLAIRMALLTAPDVQEEAVTGGLISELLASIQFFGSRKREEGAGLSDPTLQGVRSAWDEVYRLVQAIAASPDVQVEPFACCFTDVNGKAKELCEKPTADDNPNDLRVVTPLYTHPAPAEQQPVCPSCNGRGWNMDYQDEFFRATCPDCAGSGKAEHSITVQESDSAAPDVAQLVEALEDIGASWHRAGTRLEKYLQARATNALASHRKQEKSK